MSTVFDKIRAQQEEEKKKERSALHLENQDRVTKMLATRYAKEEAVKERVDELKARQEKEDEGSVFARLRRKNEKWDSEVRKQKALEKEKTKIDEYTRLGMEGQEIPLLHDQEEVDEYREQYISMRMQDSFVDRDNWAGTWAYGGKVFSNDEDKKWKDDLHYYYYNQVGSLPDMSGQSSSRISYNGEGADSPPDDGKTIYSMADFGDAGMNKVSLDMWKGYMDDWKKNGVPDVDGQMDAFREIYGAEYDDRQANESGGQRATNKFISGLTMGYGNPYEEFLEARTDTEHIVGSISSTVGFVASFMIPGGIASKGVNAATKTAIGTNVILKGTKTAQNAKKLKNLNNMSKTQKAREQLRKMAQYMEGGTKGGQLSKLALTNMLSFSLHGQMMNQPGGRDIGERLAQIPKDMGMGALFSMVGSLGRFAQGTNKYRWAKGSEYPATFALGYNMVPDDPNNPYSMVDKWTHGLMFMSLHGMGHAFQAKGNRALMNRTRRDLYRAHIKIDKSVNGRRTMSNAEVRKNVDSAIALIKKQGTYLDAANKYSKMYGEIKAYDKWMDKAGASPKEKAGRWRYLWEKFNNNLNQTGGQPKGGSRYNDTNKPVGTDRIIAEQKKGPAPIDPKTGKPLIHLENHSLNPIKNAEAKGVTLDHPELVNIKNAVKKLDPENKESTSAIQKNIDEMRNTLSEGFVIDRHGELKPIVMEEAAELSAVLDAYEAKLTPKIKADKPLDSKVEEPSEVINLGEGQPTPKEVSDVIELPSGEKTPAGDDVPLTMSGEPKIVETPIGSVKDKPKTAEYLNQLDKGGELFMSDTPYQDIRKIAKENNLEQYAADKSKGELQRVVEIWRDENFTELKKLKQERDKFTEDDNYDLGDGPISPRTGTTLKQFQKPVTDIPSAVERVKKIDKWIDNASEKYDDLPESRQMELDDQIYEAEMYRDNLYEKLEERGVTDTDIYPPEKKVAAAGGAGEPPKPPIVPEVIKDKVGEMPVEEMPSQIQDVVKEANDRVSKELPELIKQNYGKADNPDLVRRLEENYGVERIEDLTPEQQKDLHADETVRGIDSGFEVGFMGLTPQNMKLAYDGIVKTGKFLYKDLPEFTRNQAKRHGITSENFQQKFKEWSENPDKIPQKSKSMFKKIWNTIKKWWKKGKKAVLDYLKDPKMGASIEMVGKDGKKLTPKQQQKLMKETVKSATEVPKEKMTKIVDKISSKNIIALNEPVPQFKNISELSRYLTDRARRIQKEEGINLAEDTPISNEIIAQTLASEIKAENLRQWNADGWYSEKMQGALQIAEALYPQMKDPVKKQAFNFGLAITSNGQGVPSNSRIAMQQYEYYLENGRWNENFGKNLTEADKKAMGAGKEMPAMRKAFKTYNNLMDQLGEETLHKFLMTEFTVGELKNAGVKGIKTDVSGENVGTTTYGSAIFGPKVGGAFFQNVSGNYKPLTMDLHFNRNIKRITGELLPEAIKGDGKQGYESRTGLRDYSPKLKRFKNAIRGRKALRRDLGITPEVFKDDQALIQIAKEIHLADKGYKKDGPQQINKKTGKLGPARHEYKVAAQRLDEIVHKPSEAPRGGAERNRYRGIMERVVEISGEKSVADAQAKLWFPQKRLYGKYGITGESINETDYRAEFINIARERGLDDKRIKQLLGAKQLGVVGEGGIKVVQIKENKPFQKLNDAEKAAILDGNVKYGRTESELDSIMREVNSTFGAGPFTPANMKLLRYGLVKAGKFVFKDLPKHMQTAGKKLGINEVNFSQAMNMLKKAPPRIKEFFKRVYNHMKSWWKGKTNERTFDDLRRTVERRGQSIDEGTLKTYILKRNAIAHAIEGSLLKSGKVTKQIIAKDKMICLGTKSLGDIMRKDPSTGKYLDPEADLKINTYIKLLRRYENTDRIIRGGRLVSVDQQAPEIKRTVMDQRRKKVGDNPVARPIIDHRTYTLTDPDLIAEANAPLLSETYDKSKKTKNIVLGAINNTQGYMDVIQQSTGLPVYDYFESIQHNLMAYEDKVKVKLAPIMKILKEDFDYIGDYDVLDATEMMQIQAVGQGLQDPSVLKPRGVKMLEAIKDILNAPDYILETKLVRYNQWASTGQKPKGVDVNDLKLLEQTLNEQGYDAFETLLENTEGFVLDKNYMPSMGEIHGMEIPDNMRIFAGKGVLKSRKDIDKVQEGNAVLNIIRKVKAQEKLYMLDPSIDPMRRLIQNGDLPKEIETNLSNYIKEVYYKPDGGRIAHFMDTMFGQLMTGAMTDPSKWVRNLAQPTTLPFAYLPPRSILPFIKEFITGSFGKGSLRVDRSKAMEDLPSDVKEYFITNVAQDRAYNEELMKNNYENWFVRNLGPLGRKMVETIGVYKWTDTANRFKIFNFMYKNIMDDLLHAHRTGLKWKQKSKGYKTGKSLKDSLLWDTVGHYKSLQDVLLPHIESAMRGDRKAMKYIAKRIAHHVSGPTMNWEYHRTLRINMEKGAPMIRTMLRAFTYPWNVYKTMFKDANVFRRGIMKRDKKMAFNGFRAVAGRLISYAAIESLILNTLQGFKDEDNKYHWGYRMPDMFLYMPGSIAESNLKFLKNSVVALTNLAMTTVGRPFLDEEDTNKAMSGFGKHLEGTAKVYLPFYRMITRALSSIVGNKNIRPIYKMIDSMGEGKYESEESEFNLLQRGQQFLFGGGNEKNPDAPGIGERLLGIDPPPKPFKGRVEGEAEQYQRLRRP
tara:strand:+ start:12046 stop:20115 length:8070 start_codon:yes stop_codon:yes gene_type:complete